MMKIDFIRHTECAEDLLLKICQFKNLNWSYPLDSHRNWLDKHLTGTDLHLLLLNENKLIGYLNIVNVTIQCDGETMTAFGIGNVCIHPDCKGLGLGALIMSAAKFYCRRNNRIGILLCQDKNVAFYDACNWHRFSGHFSTPNQKNITSINFYSSNKLPFKIVKCNRDF